MPTTPFLRSPWAGLALLLVSATPVAAEAPDFPDLPLPPAIDGLIGMPQTFGKGRSAYLPIVAKRAEAEGLPLGVADAVAQVESAYNPNALGGVGEVGLMQIRPQTAAMLGYKGDKTGLFDPETNVQYAVAYLARAWRLASGDLCRTLMKYRAGHGEERMSPLSVEYCRRARSHLAAIGSPLAEGTLPPVTVASIPAAPAPAQTRPSAPPATTAPARASVALAPKPAQSPLKAAARRQTVRVAAASAAPRSSAVAPAPKPSRRNAQAPVKAAPTRVAKAAAPERSAKSDRVRVASTSQELVQKQAMILVKARQEQRTKAWAEHQTRLGAINAKLKKTRLNIASGI